MKFYFIYLITIFYESSSWANELIRLDRFAIEDVSQSELVVNLYITENCSVCQRQIDTIKDCISNDKIAVFIDGANEDKLRTYIKRKKIPFKTYYLTPKAKNLFGFGSVSPSITIKTKEKLKNLVGLQSCEQIQETIKAGN